jgi:hypothetical protein
MTEENLSISQLPPLPLPVQGNDLIHIGRGGEDYRVERSELIKNFLSQLQDTNLSSLVNNHSLIYNSATGKWSNSFIAWATITGKPTQYTPIVHTHTWDEISDPPDTFPPTVHTHAWEDITDIPSLFPPDVHTHDWADLTGVPSVFPPETHIHTWDEIADKPTEFTPSAHDHNSLYYTQSELNTSGAGGQVHWDNITNVPDLGTGTGDGDMSKSVYDTDEDGVVNAAASAPWTGITGKPTTFPPDAHTHDHMGRVFPNMDQSPSTTDNIAAGYLLGDLWTSWGDTFIFMSEESGSATWKRISWSYDDLTVFMYNSTLRSSLELTDTVQGMYFEEFAEGNAKWTWGTVKDWITGFADSLYAAIGHNHNSLYSALSHNHDSVYSQLGHTHAGYLTDAPSDGNFYSRKDGGWAQMETIGLVSFVVNEVPSGAVDGSNTVYTFAQGYVAGSTQVYRDGQLLKPGGNDYTETDAANGIITFVTAPATSTTILGSYQAAISTAGNADTLDGKHGFEYSLSGHTHAYSEITSRPAQREILTAVRTYYVRSNGNDSNTGLVNDSTGAFLTIQKAVDVASALDNNGYDVTIQVADGTYNEGITLKSSVGNGFIIIQGNVTTPANALVTGIAATLAAFYSIACTTKYRIKDLKISNSAYAIMAEQGSYIEVGNIDFGACSNGFLFTRDHGRISIISNCKITGNCTYVIQSNFMGMIRCPNTITITIPSAVAFSYFIYITAGMCNFAPAFAGTGATTSTGIRYSITNNGVLYTNGTNPLTYLPGNSAGGVATGGVYS